MTPTDRHTTDAGTWLRDLRARAFAWAAKQPGVDRMPATLGYGDLCFAFGLARLGLPDGAKEALRRASTLLETSGEIHQCLLRAFTFRIEQALRGDDESAPLPREWTQEVRRLHDLRHQPVIDRMRRQSRILEPHQRVSGFASRVVAGSFDRSVQDLRDEDDPDAFREQVRFLLRECEGAMSEVLARRGADPRVGSVSRRYRKQEMEILARRVAVTQAALERAPWAGSEFTSFLFDQGGERFLDTSAPEGESDDEIHQRVRFLQAALQATAWHRQPEPFLKWLGVFGRVLGSFAASPRFTATNGYGALVTVSSTVRTSVRGLFRLGLCDEADQFLNETAGTFSSQDSAPARLTMLRVAEGWYALGWSTLADPVLAFARERFGLHHPRRLMMEWHPLACASIDAVSLADRAVADKHLAGVFATLRNVTDTFRVTEGHFHLAVLEVIESVVLAAVEICQRR
jgi:hypothetical protein